jgi:hypothetical protein
LCAKPPIKKETSHRDRKERKGTDNHGSRVINPDRALLAWRSCVQNLRSKRELHTEIAKNTKERTINGSNGNPIRIGLCLFGDLCKNLRSKRELHTEIAKNAKNAKERTTTDQGLPNPDRALFAWRSCVQNLRSKRELHTEIAKNTKERTINGSKGYPIRIGLCLFGDLMCKNLRQKGNSTQRSQRTQRNGRLTDRRATQSESGFACLAILCAKTSAKKGTPHRDRKERKGTDNHGSRVTQSGSGFACLAILCAKPPIKKGTPDRDRKERKGTDDHGWKG